MRNSLSLLIVACCAALGVSVSAQMTAQGYDTPSYIQFSTPRFEVAGGETNAVVTVVRSGDYRRIASVEYSTREGTAQDSVDFESCGGTLVFDANQNFKTICIPIHRETAPVAKSFQVELAASDVNTVVVTPSAAVEIQPPPPSLAVQAKAGVLLLSWPDSGLPFKLESQVDGQWSGVSSAPGLVDGIWSVKVAATAPVAFFRLNLDANATN